MRSALVACALLAAAAPVRAATDENRFQIAVLGGVGPAEPLHTQYLAGAFVGVPLGHGFQLELSGTWQDGLEQRSELYEFVSAESLLDPKDPIADHTTWTAEGLLRWVPLRGKLAFLQTTLGGFALHLGGGVGARALSSPDGRRGLVGPSPLAAAGVDLVFAESFLVRLDTRGYAYLRRDDTVALGAELLLGLGVRL